jgi:hypothetical protein
MASKLSSGASAAAASKATPSEPAKSSPSKSSTSSAKSSTSSTKSTSSSSVSKGASSATKSSVSRAPAQSLSSGGGSSGSSSSGGGSVKSSTVTSRDTNAITPRLAQSLSSSSRDSSSAPGAAKSAYEKAAGRSLTPTAKSSALAAAAKSTQKQLSSDRSSPNPKSTDWMSFEMFDDYVNNPDAFGERTPAPVAVNPLQDFLQGPYERRVERAGGAPFEGPVDFGGIAAALFGGQSAAERDAAIKAGRTPAAARFDPINPDGGPSWAQFDDYINNTDAFGPRVDPLTGFVQDPETGTYYRPDLLPSKETRLAENEVASQPFPSFAPLAGLMEGINAEGARWDAAGMPPLPRPRPDGAPAGIDAMAIPLPGQTEGGPPIEIEVRGGNGIEESDEARYAREHPVVEPKKKTAFDSVVEMGGGLLENTGIGGIVKNLFPDIWYGTGEAIKSMDDGLTYGGRSSGTQFEYMPQNGSLSEQSDGGGYYQPLPFPDANGNGIDDRLEGFTGGISWGTRTAQFPNMPPYDPGRSNEWRYFTGPGYAEGGEVETQDPRMNLIADAEDVLEDIAGGRKPDEADAKTLKAFVAQFGDEALRALNDQVKGGMKMRGKRDARMVEGPGTGTSDSIPAVIDGGQPAALSDGEVVIPADAVRAAGQGDRDKGAAQLMALSDMLVNGG